MTTAASDYPALTFEVNFGTGPGTYNGGSWTDITNYVDGGTISTGRQYELERFAAGTCTLTLKDSTRRFDPEYTAGAYYPNIIPMVQLRVTAVWNATTYYLFYGFITDWGSTVAAANNIFYTTIVAKDAFAYMEMVSLPGSWYELAVAKDQPTHWWRLDETSGTTAVDSGYGTTKNAGTYRNSPTLDDATVVTYDGGRKGVTLDGTGADMFVSLSDIPTNPYTFECWLTCATQTDTGVTVMVAAWLGDDFNGSARAIGVGKIGANLGKATPDGGSHFSTSRVDDGLPHHIAVCSNGAWYVDAVAQTAVSGVTLNAQGVMRVGSWNGSSSLAYLGSTGGAYFAGSVAEVAVYSSVLSSTQILAHYNAGANGHSGDDTGTQLGRVLDYKNWPATPRTISTGLSTVGAYELPTSLRDYVARMADTEFGQTYIDGQGYIIHRARSALWADTRSRTSQATFGDAGYTLQYSVEDFSLVRDATLLRNPISASRSGGVTATATDTTYTTTYGERGWSAPTAYDSTDVVMTDRANYLLSRYKNLGTRLASMKLQPMRDATNLWPQALGRKIGDRITIKRTPLGSGNEISTDQLIEGITHKFGPRMWETTFRGSPAETHVYWLLDDATYSVLDTTTIPAY